MYMVYLSTMCEPGVQGGRKRMWDPLELALKIAMNCHVGAESQIL